MNNWVIKVGLACVLPFGVCSLMQAQKVAGSVMGKNGRGMSFVSVAVLNPQDSSFVGGVLTDKAGRFTIKVPEKYKEVIVRTTHVGYFTSFLNARNGTEGLVIQLRQREKELAGITVTSSRVRQDATGYIVDMRAADFAKNRNLRDALGFLPGMFEQEGVLKLNGTSISKYYIDDRPVAENSGELRNLRAEDIEKVRVEYYSMSQSGPVVYITMKQPKNGGYYGSLSAKQDYAERIQLRSGSEGGGYIVAKKGALSLYDYAYTSHRNYEDPYDWDMRANNQLTQQQIERKGHRRNYWNVLSLSQTIRKVHKIGAYYYFSFEDYGQHQETFDRSEASQRLSLLQIPSFSRTHEGNLQYTFDPGKSFWMQLKADYYKLNQTTRNRAYLQDDKLASEDRQKSLSDLWQLNADFRNRFSDKFTLMYGGAYNSVKSEYRPSQILLSAGQFRGSQTSTDTKAQWYQLYSSAYGFLGKVNYTIGMLWKLNKARYTQWLTDGVHVSSYSQNQFVPYVQAMLPFGSKKQHSLLVAYNHRLDNIPYASMSTAIVWYDNNSYMTGNPNLKASSEDTFKATLGLWNNLLSVTAQYELTKNGMEWITQEDPEREGVLFNSPHNVATEHYFSFSLNLNLLLMKCWRLNFNEWIGVSPQHATLNGRKYDRTLFRQYLSLRNSLNFKHDWTISVDGFLEPTYTTYEQTYHWVYEATFGVTKGFLRNRLQLNLMACLLGKRRIMETNTPTTWTFMRYINRNRFVRLSISWFFQKGKTDNIDTVSGSQQYEKMVGPK